MQPDDPFTPGSLPRQYIHSGIATPAFAIATVVSRTRHGVGRGSRRMHEDAAREPSALGAPVSAYGSRARFEKTSRFFNQNTKVPLEEAASRTPLHDTYGIITPSSLHFERHHSGVPDLDPATHTLTIHGLVDRPLVFTVDELEEAAVHFAHSLPRVLGQQLERVARIGRIGRAAGARIDELQRMDRRVARAAPARNAGLRPEGKWILAEGADPCRLARSLPIEKALKDVMVVYGQNGEPLRPEQGYPIRLLVPGWEGNVNVKWLRRVKVLDQPAMTREETSKYTDLMPDGTARQFTFKMEAKSLITRPSGGDTLPGAGLYELTGLAWSGQGAIAHVDVTVDGGNTWTRADLQMPVLPVAHTRFRWSWRWDGREAVIASRCTDDTGYVQPTLAELVRSAA